MAVSQSKIDKKEVIKLTLKDRKNFVVSNFVGLDVAEQNKLRNQLRQKGSVLKVVKNNLFYLALKEDGNYNQSLDKIEKDLKGSIGVAFVAGEFSAVSKVLLDYSKTIDKFKVRSACLDGAYLPLEEIKDLANLPSREELLTMIARGINSPATQIARGLKEIISSLARGIKAVGEKNAS